MKLLKKVFGVLFSLLLIILYLNDSIYRRMNESGFVYHGSHLGTFCKNCNGNVSQATSIEDFKSRNYTDNSKQHRQASGIHSIKSQFRFVIEALPEKGNLLVWGIENNSQYWNTSSSGYAIFIKDDIPMRELGKLWYSNVFKKYSFQKVYRVHYTTDTFKSFEKYNNSAVRSKLNLNNQLPVSVTQTHWHVIIIDEPLGCCQIVPGQYQSIYTSRIIARRGTHIFVDAIERKVEHRFSIKVFRKPLAVIRRQLTTTTCANEHAHFISNSIPQKVIGHGSGSKPYSFKTPRQVGENGTDNWTILLTFNNDFFDFFKNWWWHFKQIDIHIPIYAIAEDSIVFYRLVNLSDNSIKVQRSEIISINESVNYKTLLFKKMVSMRPTYILTYLKKGINIIYSDLDTVWLQNPLPHLKGNFDIWSQLDSTNNLCTGFLAIKSNSNTLNFVKTWENVLRKNSSLNQPVFNSLAKQSSVKIKALDSKRFPSGKQYFGQFSRKERAGVVVVHNNWIVGHDKKIRRFKKHKLWVNGIGS